MYITNQLLEPGRLHPKYPLLAVIDCGMLNDPSNGNVTLLNGTQFSSEATYHCDSDFVLEGNHLRICQENGTWSGTMPECKLILCLCHELLCV